MLCVYTGHRSSKILWECAKCIVVEITLQIKCGVGRCVPTAASCLNVNGIFTIWLQCQSVWSYMWTFVFVCFWFNGVWSWNPCWSVPKTPTPEHKCKGAWERKQQNHQHGWMVKNNWEVAVVDSSLSCPSVLVSDDWLTQDFSEAMDHSDACLTWPGGPYTVDKQ